MTNEPKKICCICKKEFTGHGNNPEPVFPIEKEDEQRNYCCDWCNYNVVIQARLIISDMIRTAQTNSDPDDTPWDFSGIPTELN